MNIRLKDESLAGRYRVHHATKNDCHAATTDSWLEALLAYKTLTQDARNDVVIVTDQEFDREERIYAFIRENDRQHDITPYMRKRLAQRLNFTPVWITFR